MNTTTRKQMEAQIQKLMGLLDEENFKSSTDDKSEDDMIPYVFTNILECLSDRLTAIEEKLGIKD